MRDCLIILKGVISMKASEFIVKLQQMVDEHGDLPLAVLEVNDDGSYSYRFTEIGRIEGVRELGTHDKLFDKNDLRNLLARKIFLIS